MKDYMAEDDQSTARPIDDGHAQRELAYNGQSALLQRSEGTNEKENSNYVRTRNMIQNNESIGPARTI